MMMIIPTHQLLIAPPLLLLLLSSSFTDAACTSSSGTIATLPAGATCNYANFFAALSADCQASIDTLFLNETTGLPLSATQRIAEVDALCLYDAPTQFVEIQGSYQDDRRYFAGGGDLVDGQASWNVLSGKIQRFASNLGSNTLIAFPQYAARIEYNTVNGLGNNGYPANMNLETSCQLQTAMCCFTDAGAGSTFEDNGDATTDVCRHDLRDSRQSNFIANGWSVFPGSETPTHCVGFTWKDGEEAFLGNMMFDISLHQTALKGYKRGVPGAPMCGCIEHMPVVETASCRTAIPDPAGIVYSFQYNANSGYVSASNTVPITYQACENSDLATQYKANHPNDDEAASMIDAHLVGAGNCPAHLETYLNNDEFLLEGQHPKRYVVPDPARWSPIVVGEGIHFLPPNPDPIASDNAFRSQMYAGCVGIDGVTPRPCIIRRVCDSCTVDSHMDIYYRRWTNLPPVGTNSTNGEMYFLDIFMNQWRSKNNTLNVDFGLYSTYEAAVANTSLWNYCNYDDVGVGFPRDCGPNGYVGSQWNSYSFHEGAAYANHHAFYVELPPSS